MKRKEAPKSYYYDMRAAWESDPECLVYVSEDIKGFDYERFYKGEPIKDWPEGITFVMKGEVAEDCLVVDLHWMVVSDRVRRTFEECHVVGAQFLPVRIMKDDGQEVGRYWALNVTRLADALDWEHTRWLPGRDPRTDEYPELDIVRAALRLEALKDVDVFRLAVRGRGDAGIYISERLKVCLQHAGATTGLSYDPVPTF